MKKIYNLLIASIVLVLCACATDGNGEISSSSENVESSSLSSSSEALKPSEGSESSDTNTPDEEKYDFGFNGIVKENIQTIGTVKRTPADVANEGLSSYPVYGTDFTDSTLIDAIYSENLKLLAGSDTYNEMDKDGNLYLNGEATGQKLYKHTASIGLYGGDVSDGEEAYEKLISISPRSRGNYLTSCYAPAGEIIKISVSKEDLEANPDLKIVIGQMTQTGSDNRIPKEATLTRMPMITNVMNITKEDTYVGSYFGGPIYIDGISTKTKKIDVTISGAVNYACMLYGSTTKEEYANYATSSAPYFDLEVYDKSVRHSGTAKYAKDYSYDDLSNAANLWRNIASVSNMIPGGSDKSVGITFLYDTYVIYGIAAAQVGANYIQCYNDWLSGALNYTSFVNNGSWGHIHEYNHHFQDYLKLDGEATNNAISLIEYYLFTNVSQNRTENYPVSGDWNLFTDPYRSLLITNQNMAIGCLHDELNEYADLLYSFGYEVFVNAAAKCSRSDNYDEWFMAMCNESGYDLTYYFTKIINKTISASTLDSVKALNYPAFIPAALLYEVGRVNHGKDVNSCLPFIVSENTYTMDLEKYLVIPNGFSATIKSIKGGNNVTISSLDSMKYMVLFTGSETGNIYLDLTVTNGDISSDITLILALSKEKRNLANVVSPYLIDTNTKTVINSQTTTLIEYSKIDGYYIYSASNMENLNNGNDADITWAVNYELDHTPYEMTLDMNEVALVNKLTLCQGFTTAQNGPSKFKLYGGITKDNMELLGEYKIEYTNNYAYAYFKETNIRYFKLVISAVGPSYETYLGTVGLSKLEMSLDLGKGLRLPIVNDDFTYKGNISKEALVETYYGYVLSVNNSSISFNVKGSKLVIYFSDYNDAVIVIDGVEHKIDNNVVVIDLSGELQNVIISGTYKFESLVVIE